MAALPFAMFRTKNDTCDLCKAEGVDTVCLLERDVGDTSIMLGLCGPCLREALRVLESIGEEDPV